MFKGSKLLLLFVPALVLVVLAFASSAMAEPIGLQSLEIATVNENGSPDNQAGSHPYALVTGFVLTPPEELQSESEYLATGGGLKDVRAELPPGFAGNPNATPKCTYPEFTKQACPNDTAIGEATTLFTVGDREGLNGYPGYVTSDPVYNVETPGGVAAEFAYYAVGAVPIFLDSSVRTGGDYGITVNVHNVPEIIQIYGSKVTIWGVPAAASHNKIRGNCLSKYESFLTSLVVSVSEPNGHNEEKSNGECPVNVPVRPLLTNPTSCGVPRSGTLSVDGWAEPGNFTSRTATVAELKGCEKLDFSPSINITPDGTDGSTPTGLNVDLRVPQESTTNPVGLAESDVKGTTVVLPAGVQISPSAADGLQACSNAQIGFERYEELDGSGTQTAIFSPGAPSCPNASKIATVSIATPLLEHELKGDVYLAAPQNFAGLPENPFSSLMALYLVAEEPASGVLIKIAGKVTLNPETGQLTTTFEDSPALPFSELRLEFYGTDRAPLATPALCGTYHTESTFVPWSGTPPAQPSSDFQVTSGPNGTPCSDPLPFSPALASGTTNINAGSYSELDTTLSREDGQQSISSVQLHYPAGVSGLLSGVKLCGEAEANAGTCGPESLIGESIVSVGLGNDPYTVKGGKVYITGPYRGAPFGLSIVNPAKAGPFDLQEGRPVVVRSKVEVDPHTAALTVTTDPPGTPHAIPTMIEGIPLQIKHVNVLINRPDFTFNPTNCNPQTITGTVDSAEGASSPVSIPFQVTNCGDLKFAPKFSVSTSGKTSRADGESLAVKLTYPNGPGYSNISKVKVELPKGLPSRLSTLQKACTAAQFNANPAGCPAASLVGYAKAVTPLIPVALEGPAYFVSNGAEAFPNLVVVLQGYGVTIDLVGDTFISKSGVTSSTFKSVPDAPVGSFELTLPEGPYSALTTDGNPCTAKSLSMPTEFVAQDGTTIDQSTKIAVTGCPKAKVAKHRRKPKRRRGRGKAARRGRRTGRAGR